MNTILRRVALSFSIVASTLSVTATSPATAYTWDECRGSALPYPEPATVIATPDTLTPVMINHVGRHGARFPSSPKSVETIADALDRAAQLGTITPQGQLLRRICAQVETATDGRWGQLDSLGHAEQANLARRMFEQYPEPFKSGEVSSFSSYVPRCRTSMFAFVHELSLLDPHLNISASSGPEFTPIVRFFTVDSAYLAFRDSKALKHAYKAYVDAKLPLAPLERVLGTDFPFPADPSDLAIAEYQLLAGLSAISLPSPDISTFFTPEEYNRLWSIFNLRQYLRYSESYLSFSPAMAAAPLLADIIATTDDFIYRSKGAPVQLRFGHAETLMPFLSLLRIDGAHFVAHDLDGVASGWLDFRLVPMAANARFIVFRSDSGRYYMRFDLNEQPTPLIAGNPQLYLPLRTALTHLQSLLP